MNETTVLVPDELVLRHGCANGMAFLLEVV